jgi:hypothetical protein
MSIFYGSSSPPSQNQRENLSGSRHSTGGERV